MSSEPSLITEAQPAGYFAAVRQAETAADVARERDMMHALNRVAQSVQQAHAPGKVYEAIGEGLDKLGFHTSVLVMNEMRASLRLAYVAMPDGLRRRAEMLLGITLEDFRIRVKPGGLYHDVLYGGEPRYFASLHEPMDAALPPVVRSLARRALALLGFEQGVYAPMRLNDEPIGLLVVAGRDLRETDTTAMSAFATQAAIAIQNARLYQQLESANTRLERKVARRTAELRRSTERLQAILDNSPDAVLLLTPDGRVASANPAFEAMFGYAVDQLYDSDPTLFVCPDYADEFGEAMCETMGGEAQRLELKALRQDDVTFDASLALAPIRQDDELIGMVCTLRDVTTAKELDRMKDEFVAFIAHELGTPLTSIRGYSELLLTRDLEEERQRRYLGMIQEQSVQLDDLLDELLDLSRLEIGSGLAVDPEPICAGGIVQQVAEPLLDTSPDHTLVVDVPSGLPSIRGDSKRLAQVVRNLLSNAIKYSPDGGTVTVRVRALDDFVEVSVSDEGIGISPEHQANLFEKFNRAGAAASGIAGTGLGLVICQRIVEAHGGRIDVESTPGEGSTFTFAIPIAG